MSAGCAYCTSGAVGASCNTVDDAKALPSAVFACKYPDAKKELYLGSDEHGWQWEVSVDIVEGVLEGFTSSSAPALKSCASDATNLYNDVDQAISLIEGSESTATKIEKGINILGQALEGIQPLMNDCKSSATQIENLVSTLKNGFENPWSFVYHVGKDLVVNGKDIYNEIMSAVSLWKSQSYRASGVQMGMALNQLLLGSDESLGAMRNSTLPAITNVKGSSCEDISDEKSCMSAGCAYCTSGAVGASCNTVDDAKALPSAVFACSYP